MEEEPNDHELEERLYSMLHYVDETQANVNTANQKDTLKILENAPQSTFRRYWRTSGEQQPSHFQKVNTPKENSSALNNKHLTKLNNLNPKPKEEKCRPPEAEPTIDLSIFQSPPQLIKKTIEIIEHEVNQSVLLESSDEDEVIEVALPPKPTITIESSDEDEVSIVSKLNPESKDDGQPQPAVEQAAVAIAEREVTASPVPSVVSSVSDEFIRGDCIALKISSKHHDNHSFDFSLHGADLLGQVTPSKKKKKKKSKEATTSTPVSAALDKPSCPAPETCFATPKSKAKNKKQKMKSYVVSEKSVPSADVYDSDSNQSVIESNKNQVPNADVYESDSSQSEVPNKTKAAEPENIVESSDSSISLDVSEIDMPIISKKDSSNILNKSDCSIVDLTDSDNYVTLESTEITENIVMGNVTGFQESEDYGDEPMNYNDTAPILGSTKVPQILFDNLDFDNLKGKDKVCRGRRYSLTTLRAEMEKFYNESWGGEDFNHREIQKYMSRDKSLWVIDPKDRMPALSKRKMTCNYCNRSGHRDDSCRMKPPVCYMCGSTGHYEPRCPSKICVNCGSPNHMYSTMCRNCAWWARLTCNECGQPGHPSSHCPDHWRRYHNTIDNNTPLAENRQSKKNHQLYCSGCTRRGHLVHTCRLSLPFSGLPINSPYVALYRPVYLPDREIPPNNQDTAVTSVSPPINTFPALPRRVRNKRQSKSPTVHENHLNKKKTMTITDIVEVNEKSRTDDNSRPRKNSVGKNLNEDDSKTKNPGTDSARPHPPSVEPALDYIPLSSANRDKRGHIIQDNEVSDTTDVVMSARIYVPSDVTERIFKSEEGAKWLKEISEKLSVVVDNSEASSFLSIRGKLADQEAFQRELREWSKPSSNSENEMSNVPNESSEQPRSEDKSFCDNIPKKRCNLLRKLNGALESLKNDLGDPEAIYQELGYLQNRHEQLLKNKVVNPKQLSNNRDNINIMLKKLNMVLLGQVGLADGSKHLSELYSLHEHLTNARQKYISLDLRQEIGQHYHSIFTSIPRNDYADLLKKYRNTKPKKLVKRNIRSIRSKKKNKIQKKPVGVEAPAQAPAPPVPCQRPLNARQHWHRQNCSQAQSDRPKVPPQLICQPITAGKLAFYHQRIVNSRPANGALKKERMFLVRKLHSHISSLNKKENLSSKMSKKMKKVQQQAQMFLRNM